MLIKIIFSPLRLFSLAADSSARVANYEIFFSLLTVAGCAPEFIFPEFWKKVMRRATRSKLHILWIYVSVCVTVLHSKNINYNFFLKYFLHIKDCAIIKPRKVRIGKIIIRTRKFDQTSEKLFLLHNYYMYIFWVSV